ncbi:MAG: S41 family peptidase [Opitutales bacterium]
MIKFRNCAITLMALIGAVSVPVQAKDSVPYAEVVFDEVWETVNDSFYDPNFGGLDWPAFGVQYREAVLQAQSRAEMNDLLNEMLNALKHSHLRVMDGAGGLAGLEVEGGVARVPIQLAMIENSFFVQSSEFPEVHVGDQILEVDGRSIETVLEALEEAGFGETAQLFYASYVVEASLSGDLGTSVELVVLREGEEMCHTLKREMRTDTEWVSLPGLPSAQEISVEFKELDDDIAYLQFSMFAPAIMPEIRSMIQNLPSDCVGLIIDLRNNPGGTGLMAAGLLGLLVEDHKPAGRMLLRSGELAFTGYAQSHAFLGKVAVLIDARSASTSEFFAAAVQDNQRGQIIGSTSAGMALASLFKPLRNGSSLQYVVANFERANGALIEGVGVEPDIYAPWTLDDLLSGNDPAMTAAVDYILDRMPEDIISAEILAVENSETESSEIESPEGEGVLEEVDESGLSLEGLIEETSALEE